MAKKKNINKIMKLSQQRVEEINALISPKITEAFGDHYDEEQQDIIKAGFLAIYEDQLVNATDDDVIKYLEEWIPSFNQVDHLCTGLSKLIFDVIFGDEESCEQAQDNTTDIAQSHETNNTSDVESQTTEPAEDAAATSLMDAIHSAVEHRCNETNAMFDAMEYVASLITEYISNSIDDDNFTVLIDEKTRRPCGIQVESAFIDDDQDHVCCVLHNLYQNSESWNDFINYLCSEIFNALGTSTKGNANKVSVKLIAQKDAKGDDALIFDEIVKYHHDNGDRNFSYEDAPFYGIYKIFF